VESENNSLILPYKLAKLNHQKKDLTKRWEIVFSAWSKSENKLVRKRLTAINSIITVDERLTYAKRTIEEINKLLKAGFHFDKLKLEKLKFENEVKEIKNHVSITNYLDIVLENNKNRYYGRTYLDKKHDLKVFKEFITFKNYKHLAFDEFEKKHAYEYQNYLINKKYAGKTVNCRMQSISTFYNDALRSEMIAKNPFQGIRRIKEVKTGINRAYNEIEISLIKEVLKDDYKDLWICCMLMFYCFIRPNEIRQIKIKHVNLKSKKLFVGSNESKNKKACYIDMPDPVCELIKEYLKGETDKDLLLFTCNGIPGSRMLGRNHLRERYNEALKNIELDNDLTFYSWKHTGVVKAYKSGIDIKSLQIQGRWHTIDMMDNYLKSLGLVENKQFTSVMNSIEV
jgi:integrase